jgi:hypothetical protein
MATTTDQYGNADSTNLPTGSIQAISTASLAPVAPLNVPAPTTVPTATYTAPIASVSQYMQTADADQKAYEATLADANKEVSLYSTLIGEQGQKGADTATAYQTGGVNDAASRIRNINAQMVGLNNEAQAIPIANRLNYKGSAGTENQVQNVNYDQLAQNALKALSLGQQGALAKADFDTAKELADQAITVKYAKLDAEIASKKAQLDYLGTLKLTPAQEKAKASREVVLKREEQELADKKATETAISNIGMTLRKYGVGDSVVKDVLASTDINDALMRAGNNLQDPQAKMELESIRLDQVLKRAQIARTQRETQLLGEPTVSEQKAIREAVKEAKASIPATQDKIDAVSSLMTHKGLESRVGTSIQSRTPTSFLGALGKTATVIGIPSLGGDLADKLTGQGQDFAGGIHKLTSGLSIDNLIAAKARGATFGALSDSELRILSSAASAINDWEVKDDKGVGQGVWNIDEKSFKKELTTIQELSRRALQQSQGTLYTPDEQRVMDEMFPATTASASQYFQ